MEAWCEFFSSYTTWKACYVQASNIFTCHLQKACSKLIYIEYDVVPQRAIEEYERAHKQQFINI